MSQDYFTTDDVKGKVYDWQLVKRLMAFVLPYKIVLISSIVVTILLTACYTVAPRLIGEIIDQGVKSKNLDQLYYFTFLFALTRAGYWLFSVVQTYSLQYIGQKVLYDLRNALFVHLHSLPISFFDKNPVGRLVTRTTNDVASLSEIFASGLINVFGNIISLVTIAISLIYINPVLGIATLGTAPLLLLSAWFLQVKMRHTFRVARQKLAIVNSSLAENISGMNIIHIFGQEEERAQKFDDLNLDLKDAQLKSVFYNSFFRPVVTVLNAITSIVILTLGGHMVAKGEISMGVLVSFLTYAQIFFYPIREISEKISMFQASMAAAERIFALFDEDSEGNLEDGDAFTGIQKSIQFDNLSFSYTPGKTVLNNLNFTITKGETIAIVGHTGAGKTTLASVLKRFYQIDKGDVLFDGKSISSFSKETLRKKISLIQQDVFIFSGTIAENISLGSQDITDERIQEIIQELEMQHFIDNLSDGFKTEIFEKGKNLSAGQRQLISFARAMAFNPDILILDEATSSMDTATELIIQRAITRLTKGRTSIIIAHRLSTIKNCNRIFVLHNGELVEQGSHDDLIREKGFYQKLYEIQFSL